MHYISKFAHAQIFDKCVFSAVYTSGQKKLVLAFPSLARFVFIIEIKQKVEEFVSNGNSFSVGTNTVNKEASVTKLTTPLPLSSYATHSPVRPSSKVAVLNLQRKYRMKQASVLTKIICLLWTTEGRS